MASVVFYKALLGQSIRLVRKQSRIKNIVLLIVFAGLLTFTVAVLYNLQQWSDTIRPETEFVHVNNTEGQYNAQHFHSNHSNPGKFYRVEWSTTDSRARPWFMDSGSVLPSSKYSKHLALWPEDVTGSDLRLPQSDRIVNQLMFVPEHDKLRIKTILLFFGHSTISWLKLGREQFLQDKCPVNSCSITDDVNLLDSVDAVFFKDRFSWPPNGRRNPHQVWILFLLENPLHTMNFRSVSKNVFNWTATYRHDSDIVAPYGKFVHYYTLYDEFEVPSPVLSKPTNVSIPPFDTKSPQVAWFVSNCGARNGRLAYARELSKHIPVDIFGSCGQKKCPKQSSQCLNGMQGKYRFYLSYENTNCRDYITEKFYGNALGHNVIPIVMGAPKADYERDAPYNSFIHVDDFQSPKHLALFLHQIIRDPVSLDRYNQWRYSRRLGGEMINTYFWCRVCAMLHAPPKPTKSYENFHDWWDGDRVCLKTSSEHWPRR